MKNIIKWTIVVLILIAGGCCLVNAQTSFVNFNKKNEYFNVSASVDPYATYKDGFADMNLEVEYVGFIYAKAGIEYFPALEPGYFDWHGAAGINLMLGKQQNTFRLYSGIRLGRIHREDKSKGELFGIETGIDLNISERWFVGVRGTYDYRNDGKGLGWSPFWRESGYIRVGYKWNWKTKSNKFK